jgi:hypothetical protein
MKQLLSLFLFLLPCLAWAQYPSNGNQKITLGEQSTADGLVYRGVLADTGIITPSSDTSAYIILDTINNRFFHYKRNTNIWSIAGGSDTSLIAYVNTYETQTVNGAKTFSNTVTGAKFTVTDSIVTGNGIYLPSTNNLAFSTNSTEKMRIDASGNVAFNTRSTTNPINATPSGFTYQNANTRINLVGSGTGLTTANLFMFDPVSYTNNSDTVNARFFMMAANPYSSNYNGSQNNGPYFFLSGLGRTAEKGTITFVAGNPSNTSGDNGKILFATGAGLIRLTITPGGNIGIGQTSPTAVLHLKAGTATASTAPLKFTSGTNLTTAEAGAMEFNGTNLFFSPSTTRHTVNHGLTGSATLNFPSTLTMLSADLTITVTGAADGDVVSLGVPNAAVNANTFYSAWVSAANTVTVRFNNYSIGTVDPASALFKVFVTK